MPAHQLTRRALYELAWSKPMITAAEELGISDVGLKKVCAKHRIPPPPRGYWAKLQAGKPAQKALFREVEGEQVNRIVIHGNQSHLPAAVQEVLAQERARRKAAAIPKPAAGTRPAEPIMDVHPSIARTARTLRSAKPDKECVMRAQGDGLCGVEVGVASRERAITILDGLARAPAARGLTLTPAGHAMTVAQAPDTVTLSLTEGIGKRPHIATPEELGAEEQRLKKLARQRYVSDYERAQKVYPDIDFYRSGELTLQFEHRYVDGLRRTWRDGKTQRLEGMIEDIAAGVVAYLAGIKAKREARERWEREWAWKQQVGVWQRSRVEREEKRLKLVATLEGTVAEIRRLRVLLATLKDCGNTEEGEFGRMAGWVVDRVARLEAQLVPAALTERLREAALFPEVDPLATAPVFEG